MTGVFASSIEIDAPPSRVFSYFTDPTAILEWIGDYAVLDARPGGEFTLDIEGVPIRGQYLTVDRPHRIVVSWGHAGSDAILPGSTEVEFNLEPIESGTRVSIEHRNLPDEHLPSHQIGWPMFLDRLQAAIAS